MIQKTVLFFKDVKSELAQVSWPTFQELLGSTKVVLVTIALLSMVIAFFDVICARLISWIIR
ncbi:MAG: preprotein translocase subunit SecE [Candidatus Omnitrophica bacterium]|nr:preprotein translocase subunit SecE [Candidatus Omnitrophota bacterium]